MPSQPALVDRGSFDARIEDLCLQGTVNELLCISAEEGDPRFATEPYRVSRVRPADLASPLQPVGGVIALGVLESLPDEDLPWVLDTLFGAANSFVLAAVQCRPTRGREGMTAHGNVRGAAWWRDQFALASRRHPSVYWELFTTPGLELSPSGSEMHYGGTSLVNSVPSVWVLEDARSCFTEQVTTVAEQLGWPYETRSPALPHTAPWPDLVLSSGKQAAAAARRIRSESGGRTRIVHMGEDGVNPADHFDLTVVPPHAGLFSHAWREEACLPIARITSGSPRDLNESWVESFESATGRRIGLLVGGGPPADHVTPTLARDLAAEVEAAVRRRDDTLFVAVTHQTPAGVVTALRETLHESVPVEHENGATDGGLYAACLVLADVLVVAGGSESALPDACATDKPVTVYPVSPRPRRFHQRLKDLATSRALSEPFGNRGTPRPQSGLPYWCARMVEAGRLRPAPDPRLTWDHLRQLDRIRMFDGEFGVEWSGGPSETERVAARVRELVGRSLTVAPSSSPE